MPSRNLRGWVMSGIIGRAVKAVDSMTRNFIDVGSVFFKKVSMDFRDIFRSAAGLGRPPVSPAPNTTSATPSAANSGFWRTPAAQGVGQIMGMGLIGGGVGAGTAWLSGGNIGQGFVMGGLAGMVGGAYASSLNSGFRQGMAEMHTVRMRYAAKGYRAEGLRGKDKAAKAAARERFKSMRESRDAWRSTNNDTRAVAWAAGAGLAGGFMFSGHRRKNVNGYNSRRGNYIGV